MNHQVIPILIKEYRYKPPFKYLIMGVGMTFIGVLFILMFNLDEIWVSIIMTLLALMFIAFGIGLLAIFVNKFGVGNLKIGQDYIEIPGRWKNRTTVTFPDIKDISEFETYDHVIEIESSNGVHLIERNWMKKKDFYAVRDILKDWGEKTTHNIMQ